jgi:hypothetical protein
MPVFFELVINNTIKHIKGLLDKPVMQNVKYLFLVGGFSESPILQEKISVFQNRLKVIIPPRPGVAVVQGAVLFGLNPTIITKRVMPQSIGIGVNLPWNDKEHSGRSKGIYDGIAMCEDAINIFVNAGQSVGREEIIQQNGFFPVSSATTQMSINIYGTTATHFKYRTDEGARYIGVMLLDVPDVDLPKKDRLVDVRMKFGGTTFSVTAVYRKTGKSVNAKFSFSLGTCSTKFLPFFGILVLHCYPTFFNFF